MNKAITVLIMLLLFNPRLSFSGQVTININANVVERSCSISNDIANLQVTLESNDLREKKIGIPFSEVPFSIILEDCPKNISAAHIIFTGERDIIMGNLLKNLNETESGAKNIAIGIYNSNKVNIDISNNETILMIDHNLTNNIFNFYASYIRTSSTASAGKILSIANFELLYD